MGLQITRYADEYAHLADCEAINEKSTKGKTYPGGNPVINVAPSPSLLSTDLDRDAGAIASGKQYQSTLDN